MHENTKTSMSHTVSSERTSRLPACSQCLSDQKDLKNLGEKGALAYPRTSQIFKVSSIISGTRTATNFKFLKYIQRVHANKSRLKI